MSHSETESLHFYEYLCQKIGSEEVVKVRRLTCISEDMRCSKFISQISSGSKGEGLDLKGSDIDIIYTDPLYAVYESDKDVVQDIGRIVLIMDTEDTQPCFTHLRLYTNYDIISYSIQQKMQLHRGMNLLSSELYKSKLLKQVNVLNPLINTIHGPCLSDNGEIYDYASSIKCDQFNSKHRNTLINILKKSYQKEIQIFLSSQTLHDYRSFPFEITRSECEINALMKMILVQIFYQFETPIINILNILNALLLHCKTELSRCIFKLATANAYQSIILALPPINNSNNKQQYKNYKLELSQLLVGVHSDAISGWLKLASFLYVHKSYSIAIDVINYTLSKCTDESSWSKVTLKQNQKLMLISQLKRLPSKFVVLGLNSSVMPYELKFDHVEENLFFINSMPFAHFLCFLCYYHLRDFKSCRNSVIQLSDTVTEHRLSARKGNNFVSLGIAFQMLDERDLARIYFSIAVQNDDSVQVDTLPDQLPADIDQHTY
ncbi:unnamed protein product [Mytilus coruscus]|uniref:Uncharacterized protein n=1 Tax=Mytilus coruscus TaxID=42192 RepID=A0A6J8DBH2_MYTCO|nr:unnamed protein product [Mytilus coruscus]